MGEPDGPVSVTSMVFGPTWAGSISSTIRVPSDSSSKASPLSTPMPSRDATCRAGSSSVRKPTDSSTMYRQNDLGANETFQPESRIPTRA